MARRLAAAFALIAILAACAPLTAPGAPAEASRMGRFLGLVSSCGCTNISADQMRSGYAKAFAGSYDAAQLTRMQGYVEMGLSEHFANQDQICTDVCAQRCAVETVAKAFGSRSTGVAACPITEGYLHLTNGDWMSDGF